MKDPVTQQTVADIELGTKEEVFRIGMAEAATLDDLAAGHYGETELSAELEHAASIIRSLTRRAAD